MLEQRNYVSLRKRFKGVTGYVELELRWNSVKSISILGGRRIEAETYGCCM